MRNRHDMYINYERNYKKHRKKSNPKLFSIILVILLALGLAYLTYRLILAQGNPEDNEEQNIPEEVQSDSTDKVVQIPTYTPTETIMPSIIPTLTPTPVVRDVVTQSARKSVNVKGIYVTAAVAGSDTINDLIALTDTTELNAMVIDVKDDLGRITYAMDSTLVKEIEADTNVIADMKELVKNLKDKGIYLIARIVAFKDPYLAEKRQELAIKKPDGSLFRDDNGDGWVNPYNKKVWDYLVEVATRAAAIGFDEIQFDYIRFSTSKGIGDADFGEEAKTKSKEDIIIEFTKYAYEKIKPLGVAVSADVYGTIISSSIDSGLVGQNYVEMSKYLDYICPMIYPSHFGEGNYGIQYPDLEPYHIINKVLNASKTKLDQIPETEHRAVVRPWLQDFTATWVKKHMKYGSTEIKEQIRGVYDAGYEEWLLWNAGANYTVKGLVEE